jgi:gliding motility-associated-like protein
MKTFSHILFWFCSLSLLPVHAQVMISAPEASGGTMTDYQGVSTQDDVFVFCPSQNGVNVAQLTATVNNPNELYEFSWSKFNTTTNTYDAYFIDYNLTVSTISDLQDGGYSVEVYNQLGEIVGCERAWVFTNNPKTTISKLPEFCSPFQLHVNIDHKNELTYYNPPLDALTIDETTEITVCFSANHSYVSDLGFYLVGPPSCGSPSIKLMESFAITQNNDFCNGGDNISQLCFSSKSSAFIISPCDAPTPLIGTYASADGWEKLYGCQANASGWQVQIFDCISGDNGTLTNAQITFSSPSNNCRPIEINYASGDINSPIKDNSCTTEKASSFVVEATAAAAQKIPNEVSYQWTENAPFFEIANNGQAKSIYVPRPPKTLTLFEVTSTDQFGCHSMASVDYYFNPITTPTISAIPLLCNNYEVQKLTAFPDEGVWAGTGIIDRKLGLFDPSIVGPQPTKVFYTDTSMCGGVAIESFQVKNTPDATIIGKKPLCDYDLDGNLALANSDTGYWQYAWYKNDFELLARKDSSDLFLYNISVGSYHAIINHSNECIDTVSIHFKSQQLADVSIEASTIETSVEVPFIEFFGGEKHPLVNSWFLMDNIVVATNTDEYSHEFPKLPRVYQAAYVGVDNIGCYDTAKVDVTLIHEFAFYIPNTFTPNGDGINDFLKVFATDLVLSEYEFEIINRWGDRVFYSRNIYERWNGYYGNNKVPEGRYLYRVVGKSKTTGQTAEATDFIYILY